MRDRAFRDSQHAQLRDPHIAPFTELIDELRQVPGRGWMPYLAPMYGGVHARVLSVFQDPGPMTAQGTGSGMLCCENDDPSAERHASLLAEAGIAYRELLPWNAYPWYIHEEQRRVSAADLDAAADALRRLVVLAPRLRVVMLHGRLARGGWRRFRTKYPTAARPFTVVETFHTSRTAFRHPDPAVRQARLDDLRRAFAEVADLLRAADAA
jgi:hypothetical protein